jgi:hypothetical protein
MTDTRAATLGKAVVYDTHSDTSVATLAKAVVYATHNDARVATLGKIVVYSTQAIPPDPNTPAPILPGAQRTTLYLCEAIGARIIAFGIGASQIGDDYQFELETWDFIPSRRGGRQPLSLDQRRVAAHRRLPAGRHADRRRRRPGRAGVLARRIRRDDLPGARAVAARRPLRGANPDDRRAGDLEIENVSVTFTPIRVFP